MIVAAAVDGATYNVAARVDPKATDRRCGSRYIDSGKASIAEQKTMGVTAGIYIETDDVASWVDPFQDGESGPGFLDGHEFTVA